MMDFSKILTLKKIHFLLQVDVELAKQQANKPAEDDLELRKKLWLRIGPCSLIAVYFLLFFFMLEMQSLVYN